MTAASFIKGAHADTDFRLIQTSEYLMQGTTALAYCFTSLLFLNLILLLQLIMDDSIDQIRSW